MLEIFEISQGSLVIPLLLRRLNDEIGFDFFLFTIDELINTGPSVFRIVHICFKCEEKFGRPTRAFNGPVSNSSRPLSRGTEDSFIQGSP